MSIESAKAFLERVKNDEDWRTKLCDAGGKEERLAIVYSEGFEFAEEEFKKAKDELSEAEFNSITTHSGAASTLLRGDCLCPPRDCPYGER